MSIGRRDYTYGFLSEAGSGSRSIESYVSWHTNVIAGRNNATVYEYTIPDGKRLCINRFIFSSDSPTVNRAQFTVDDITKAYVHFTNFVCYPFSDQNPYYVVAGEVLKIIVYNTYINASTFYISIIGAMETL